ncbi:hypothetical protein CC78DRAFT_535134 [Lojkania enalia]|uniref:DUF1330 domain-containing protein n=1 Tax=Lojkania enalia TaxID=147567 RepID=A0A9P4N4L3_9PLEO|nr:hypothetical protein CC78DRAFT_535134 [Didymosphaeria enalia]
MPLCTLHLLSLHPTIPLKTFLATLHSTSLSPLVISKVLRWIILPTQLSTDALLAQNIHWDILLILPSTDPLPPPVTAHIAHAWTVTAGIPSRLLRNFSARNDGLLHADPSTTPRLNSNEENHAAPASSPQNLELAPELQDWISAFSANRRIGTAPVSMLNLLSFKQGMKDSYLEYGKRFAESIGSSRGGVAKLVGTVTHVGGGGKGDEGGGGKWDEVALAHYPSILHFADMLRGRDYQEVNKKYRVPALRDTFILCTSEIAIEDAEGSAGAKL